MQAARSLPGFRHSCPEALRGGCLPAAGVFPFVDLTLDWEKGCLGHFWVVISDKGDLSTCVPSLCELSSLSRLSPGEWAHWELGAASLPVCGLGRLRVCVAPAGGRVPIGPHQHTWSVGRSCHACPHPFLGQVCVQTLNWVVYYLMMEF